MPNLFVILISIDILLVVISYFNHRNMRNKEILDCLLATVVTEEYVDFITKHTLFLSDYGFMDDKERYQLIFEDFEDSKVG